MQVCGCCQVVLSMHICTCIVPLTGNLTNTREQRASNLQVNEKSHESRVSITREHMPRNSHVVYTRARVHSNMCAYYQSHDSFIYCPQLSSCGIHVCIHTYLYYREHSAMHHARTREHSSAYVLAHASNRKHTRACMQIYQRAKPSLLACHSHSNVKLQYCMYNVCMKNLPHPQQCNNTLKIDLGSHNQVSRLLVKTLYRCLTVLLGHITVLHLQSY